MILVALGANLESDKGGPRETLEAALAELEARGVRVTRRSRWYESAPVPPSDQPWFVNAVAAVETDLDPAALLALLHEIEADLGRVRERRNEPRVVDLDLVCYDECVCRAAEEGVDLPHPRLDERAFVLLPLAEVAPNWRHPVTGEPVDTLIAALPEGQVCRPMEADSPGPEGGPDAAA